ncbi:hypothetical protein COL30_03620 [Bacillus pseudomycoides]|uniref:Uncharacterized protein n=1 Tax=Bacillus pseudomycoides TaxID=64104 RepID=A0A2B6RS65_9BACI|nr:hypothetical protein CON79_28520 [Bacillus pseudomycoides]PEA82895.1 hypothetical protein CON99_14670 [Bacillus pseudomycoides]PED07564.1 hypothetical protein COO19_14970 [Bacillus pseudomycoides]PED70585.1 hypothetical protein CON97_18825 [Bacillus pseudomycoides]PEI41336.1 hypothetical protein CN620_13695 [Bacillus pseudomycoides]
MHTFPLCNILYCVGFFYMNGWLLYHMRIVKIIDNKFMKLHLNLLCLDKSIHNTRRSLVKSHYFN